MKKRAFLFVILASIFWGTSGLFVHALSPLGFTSAQMTFARGIVSFLCIAVYLLIRDRSAMKAGLIDLLLYGLVGISLFGTGYFYFSSIQLSSVSTAVILMYTAPIFVMAFSVLFLGEKLTWKKTVAVVAMLIGCCLVAGVIGGFRFHPLGILFGLLSGISYATYNVVTKIALKRGGKPITATFYGFLAMSLVALIFCDLPDMVGHAVAAPWPSVPLLIALGVITYVIPYTLYTIAMNTLEAGTAATLGIVEPMAATLFSFAFLGEQLGIFSMIGIVLILFAVFFLGYAEKN